MMNEHSKTIRLSCGGSVTLTINADVFKLRQDEREFVIELFDTFNDVVFNEPQARVITQAVEQVGRPPVVTAEITEKVIELIEQGASISTAAIIVGVHRNSLNRAGINTRFTQEIKQKAAKLVAEGATVTEAASAVGFSTSTLHKAGIHYGGQGDVGDDDSDDDLSIQPNTTPLQCVDCGKTCTGTRCKECYDKQVAENKQREAGYREGVAERKRQREIAKSAKVSRAASVAQKSADQAAAQPDNEPPISIIEDPARATKNLAVKLWNNYLAQCNKMNIRPDARFAEF